MRLFETYPLELVFIIAFIVNFFDMAINHFPYIVGWK